MFSSSSRSRERIADLFRSRFLLVHENNTPSQLPAVQDRWITGYYGAI